MVHDGRCSPLCTPAFSDTRAGHTSFAESEYNAGVQMGNAFGVRNITGAQHSPDLIPRSIALTSCIQVKTPHLKATLPDPSTSVGSIPDDS